MALNIEELRQYCREGQTVYAKHFVDQCRKRNILIEDAENALLNGEIIEDYPNDYPFPSCLILGFDLSQNSLHIVCAQGGGWLYMITAYRPSLEKWEADMKTRKGVREK